MKKTQLKKVLIALDYNPTSQKVAEEGFSIAKKMGAEVILLHVIIDSVYYSSTEYTPILGFAGHLDMGQMQLNNSEGLKKAAQHFLDTTKHHLDDSAITTLVREGNIVESILAVAAENHAALVVMGSHSQRWLENIVIGSVTEEVLRQTKIPLLIIPTKKHRY